MTEYICIYRVMNVCDSNCDGIRKYICNCKYCLEYNNKYNKNSDREKYQPCKENVKKYVIFINTTIPKDIYNKEERVCRESVERGEKYIC